MRIEESYGYMMMVEHFAIDPKKQRPSLALMAPAIPARVTWRGTGRVGPPFFITQMLDGPTELAAVCGTFYNIVATRIRHNRWLSWSQYSERLTLALSRGWRWQRNMDDWG